MIPSDEDQEDQENQEADSEPDEGIHMPSTFRQNKSSEVSRMTASCVFSKDGVLHRWQPPFLSAFPGRLSYQPLEALRGSGLLWLEVIPAIPGRPETRCT